MRRWRVRIVVTILGTLVVILATALVAERRRSSSLEHRHEREALSRRIDQERMAERIGGGPFTIGIVPGCGSASPRISFLKSSDALVIISMEEERRVRVWNVATKRFSDPPLPPMPEEVSGPTALSSDGHLLAYRERTEPRSPPRLRILDLTTGTVRATCDLTNRIPRYGLAFSPDGARIAVGLIAIGTGGEVALFETVGGRLLSVFRPKKPVGVITRILFSPDGTIIALAGLDPTVVLVDAATGEERTRFERVPTKDEHHTPAVDTLAFSPNSRLLAEVRDNEVMVREVATGRELFRDKEGLGSGFASRSCVAGFTPDGEHVATVSKEGHARLLEIPTGRVARKLDLFATGGPKQGIIALALTTDCRTLAGTLDKGDVVVWDLSSLRPPQ